MANGWTQERRQKQSEAIRTWKPWSNSTGPRTSRGKAEASQNAFKGGIRPLLRKLAKVLDSNQQALDELSAEDLDSMAETVVAAALNGNIWAVQVIARAIDE